MSSGGAATVSACVAECIGLMMTASPGMTRVRSAGVVPQRANQRRTANQYSAASVSITRNVESMRPPFALPRAALCYGARCRLLLLRSRLQKIEHSGVNKSMSASAHLMTGPWHQFAPAIRNKPKRPSQRCCGIADDLVIAKKHQRRHLNRPQFAIREHGRHDTRSLLRHPEILQTEIRQFDEFAHAARIGI